MLPILWTMKTISSISSPSAIRRIFYVNEKGKLTLVFDKYEVAPGYMGMVEFSIPTGEIVDMVTNGYLK